MQALIGFFIMLFGVGLLITWIFSNDEDAPFMECFKTFLLIYIVILLIFVGICLMNKK